MFNVLQKKSKWIVAAAVAALVAPIGTAMAASTVDDVVNKYVDAIGGIDKVTSVKTVVKKGQFLLIDMGMSASLESTNAGANYKQTIAVEGMGEITQGITDGTVWQLHFMEGDSVLEGSKAEDVARQADVNTWGNWKNYFASAEVAGEEEGDTKVVFKSKEDGGQDTVAYFDNETGLLDKIESAGPDGSPAVMSFSEYKDVNGVKFAYKTEIVSGMNIEMIFDSIETDVDVDPAVFEIPEVIKAQMPADGVTAAQLMEQMDANKDGKITMDEAPEQLQASFAMVDMNADEGIDIEEAQLIADFINNQ